MKLEQLKKQSDLLNDRVEKLNKGVAENERKLNELLAKIREVEQEELIPVPDDIVFWTLGKTISIQSPGGKHCLWYSDLSKTWQASSVPLLDQDGRIYPKGLKKVDYNELKPGDWCTTAPIDCLPPLNTDQIELVVEFGRHKAWNNDDVVTLDYRGDIISDNWYRVVF